MERDAHIPDFGRCVNLYDKNSLDTWGVTYTLEEGLQFSIYNVSEENIPLMGTVSVKLHMNNKTRQVDALVTTGSPIRDLKLGWKTLSNWGLLTLAAMSSPISYIDSPT